MPKTAKSKALAQGSAPSAVKERPNTYYHSFPDKPRPDSALIHVFWVVANDHRMLSQAERRNVLYPAKKHGLMEAAPRDQYQCQINENGAPSRSRAVLTNAGWEYYDKHILPLIPQDFESELPCAKRKRQKVLVDGA